MYWQTNQHRIIAQPPPEGDYFAHASEFARLWLENNSEFTLRTSGSTGEPKPITLHREQLISSARLTGEALRLPAGTRALVCLNLRYIAGTMMLVRGLVLDWELTITEPIGNPLLELPPDVSFDFVAMVPLQLQNCLENKTTRKRVSELGKILLGGAPVGIALLTQIKGLRVPVYQSYGMTETVSHVALRQLNGEAPSEEYTVLNGVTFGVDNRGCLYVCGPMTQHQTIQTNDLVEITSEQSFRWIGRADNVINSGGVKIQLEKMDELMERILYEIGCSFEFFCWYEPDEKLGQRLILIVKNRDVYFPAEKLNSEIRERESAYAVPKKIYFVDEFSKTPTEKIDKKATVELLTSQDTQ